MVRLQQTVLNHFKMDIWDQRKEFVFWKKRVAMNYTSPKDTNGEDDSVL